MSTLSPHTAARPKEDQFVGDLASLFHRHRVRMGAPEYLIDLASTLLSNNALRSDLLMLCNAISHMAEADLSPEELLQLVAKTVAGPASIDGRSSIPIELREVFLGGWLDWQARSETLSASYWADPDPETRNASHGTGKFARAAIRQSTQRAPSAPVADAPGISPETRLGELTISQLRIYLEDIEQRVDRLQPLLAQLDPGVSVPLAPVIPKAEQADENNYPEIVSTENTRAASVEVPAERMPTELATAGAAAVENTTEPTFAAEPLIKTAPRTGSTTAGADHRTELALRGMLRDVPGAGQHATASKGDLVMFRAVSDPENSWGRGYLWAAAALALLLPAAYYGHGYLYQPPATMPVVAPQPPAYLPAEPAHAGAATPARQANQALAAKGHSAPRLLPNEVRMEAQAARAEQ